MDAVKQQFLQPDIEQGERAVATSIRYKRPRRVLPVVEAIALTSQEVYAALARYSTRRRRATRALRGSAMLAGDLMFHFFLTVIVTAMVATFVLWRYRGPC